MVGLKRKATSGPTNIAKRRNGRKPDGGIETTHQATDVRNGTSRNGRKPDGGIETVYAAHYSTPCGRVGMAGSPMVGLKLKSQPRNIGSGEVVGMAGSPMVGLKPSLPHGGSLNCVASEWQEARWWD